MLSRGKILLFIGVLFFAVSPFYSYAQSVISPTRKAELERELANLEAQINEQRKILDGKRQETQSLERDVAILNAKIKEAQLAVRARDLSIQKLSQDISGKQNTIGKLTDKLDREKSSLAQILRKTNELEDYSLVEFALANKGLSDFFSDADSFQVIKADLHKSFEDIVDTRTTTEGEKASLEEKKQEQVELRQLQVLQQRKIESQEKEKKDLLKITKGVEGAYQKILSEQEKNAAQIRSALFALQGSAAIPFEKALQYAEVAYAKTGVRPAFILGIIAEESNLGQNVGTGNWRIDMHPTRDVPIFDDIARSLGFNPETLPVSKKAWYGWGGAMGPAQFIPSTWVLYTGYKEQPKNSGNWVYDSSEDRIGSLTGHTPPNPWDPEDAFMASAILLKDNGATKGTRSAERLAALRYLAGWKNAEKPAYAFYGDDVMDLADKYQRQIDILKGR